MIFHKCQEVMVSYFITWECYIYISAKEDMDEWERVGEVQIVLLDN